ncbi:MAG: hypothetical protein AMXMBFR77_27750 [Phycisphaerales bacterium]
MYRVSPAAVRALSVVRDRNSGASDGLVVALRKLRAMLERPCPYHVQEGFHPAVVLDLFVRSVTVVECAEACGLLEPLS